MNPNPRPTTFYVDPDFALENLDYVDMVALSGLFRRWALYEPGFTPDDCTDMMCWSSDYEHLANWVGPNWWATDPTESLLPFIARLERRSSTVIDARQFFQFHRRQTDR